MNMGGTLQSPDTCKEIIPLISDVTYAIDDLLQKVSLRLVLGMSYIQIRVSIHGIGANKIDNRRERSRLVCGSIYPGAVVALNRFWGETSTNSAISQQKYESRCSLSPDGTTLHGRATIDALVARIFGIAKESIDQFRQTCHARFTTRPTAFSGISFIGAQPNNIADDEGRQA